MKQPKPITIKQKCTNCSNGSVQGVDCHICLGTGQQETKITPLRDFEYAYGNDTEFKLRLIWIGKTGYKIPKEYEPYEIKKVQELEPSERIELFKLNLKEDDKVVVRRR